MIDQQIVFLYVRDLEVSRRFYLGVLGHELLVDQGKCLILRTSPGGYLGICQRADGGTGERNVILTFVTERVDEWYRDLQTAGIKVQAPPCMNPEFGIYHFFAEDPDGYLLEFQQFQDPDWNKPRTSV